MRTVTRHGNPKLARWGADAMIAGAVIFFLPLVLPRADGLADAHELVTAAVHHLWWQFAGASVFSAGSTLRLIGIQGHPGLPWPSFLRSLPPDLVATIQLRRRARENRVRALAQPPGATTGRRRRRGLKLAFARVRRMRRGRPHLVRRRRRDESPSYAG